MLFVQQYNLVSFLGLEWVRNWDLGILKVFGSKVNEESFQLFFTLESSDQIHFACAHMNAKGKISRELSIKCETKHMYHVFFFNGAYAMKCDYKK